MAPMRALLALFLVLGCGDDGPPAGKVARVGGETYRMGARIQIDPGNRERFRHRYRFRAEAGEVLPIQAETGGMLLEISISRPGERPRWERGPNAEIRDRFTPRESGVHELVISGDSLTYGNSYRLTVGR